MKGLKDLNDLPQEKKDSISEEFGSIGGLYKKVFDLNNEDYKLNKNKPENYKNRQNKIAEELFDIENKLEEMDICGDAVVSEISADFGEIIVKKHIENLDKHLRTLGTEYETMRIWMKDNYNL